MKAEDGGRAAVAAGAGPEGWRRLAFPACLGLAFLLFILVRLQGFSALLNWDEGRSIIILRAVASGDPGALYYGGIYVHPPLYLLLCRMGMALFGESATLYRLISLAFSCGSFFALFLLVREISGRATALFACLALALLPAASGTGVWIKEDSACVFWMLCALYAFVRRRYFMSGMFLGLSLLSKENGVLLLLVLPAYLLAAGEKREAWRGLLVTAGVAALMSGWWYVFFSETGGTWLGFFSGSTQDSRDWAQPWYYYLSGAAVDLGWPLLLLSVWGCADSIRGALGGEDRRSVLPVVWVAACYLPLSFSGGKPFWMITAALPAWAWLAGTGLKGLLGLFVPRGRALACFVLAAALAVMLGVNYHNGGARYTQVRCPPHYDLSVYCRDSARFINSEADEGAVLMIWPYLNPNPLLLINLRPDIHYVLLPTEHISAEGMGDLLGLWSGEGVEAAYFYPDEWGEWLAEAFQYYMGGSVRKTAFFLVFRPRAGGPNAVPTPRSTQPL